MTCAIFMSSAYIKNLQSFVLAMTSLKNVLKRNGPRLDPCATPLLTQNEADLKSPYIVAIRKDCTKIFDFIFRYKRELNCK